MSWLEAAALLCSAISLAMGYHLGRWSIAAGAPTSPADLEALADGLRGPLPNRAADLYVRAALAFEMQEDHYNAESCWLLASRCSVDARNECLMRRTEVAR